MAHYHAAGGMLPAPEGVLGFCILSLTPPEGRLIEIYFSVVRRKVLTPNDFADLDEVESRLLAF